MQIRKSWKSPINIIRECKDAKDGKKGFFLLFFLFHLITHIILTPFLFLRARMEKRMILTICDGKEQKKNAVKEVLLDFCSREQLELMEKEISGISLFLQKGQEEFLGEEEMQKLFLKLSQERNQITYPFVEGQTTLPVEEILYIESNKHKNWFHTAEATYSIYRKLNDIEQELMEYGFIRIHQSFLVNMRYIAKISSYTLTLTSGETFSVPKVRYSQVKRKFMKYKGVEFE